MTAGLVTRSTKRDEVMGVVALGLCVVEDVMNVQLVGVGFCGRAQYAAVIVAALDDRADSFPPLTPIAVSASLPVGRPVTSAPVHRISGARAIQAHALACLGCHDRCGVGIALGVLYAMFCIAIDVAEYTIGVARPPLVCLAALGAGHRNLSVAKLGKAFARAKALRRSAFCGYWDEATAALLAGTFSVETYATGDFGALGTAVLLWAGAAFHCGAAVSANNRRHDVSLKRRPPRTGRCSCHGNSRLVLGGQVRKQRPLAACYRDTVIIRRPARFVKRWQHA